MDKKIPAQSTCETCLPICLMTLLRRHGFSVSDSEEMDILVNGLQFTKLDYSTGQLVYICKKYDISAIQYVDFKIFCEQLTKLPLPINLKIENKKIDLKFINQNNQILPVIIYIDTYVLNKIYHAPHFVILESIGKTTATILDPWDGKEKIIPIKTLIRSVQSLRNNLKLSPKLIRLIKK